jgi:hypothetical protein
MILSKVFLAAVAGASAGVGNASSAPKISVGAIRWDAWYWDASIEPGPANTVGRAVTLGLGRIFAAAALCCRLPTL